MEKTIFLFNEKKQLQGIPICSAPFRGQIACSFSFLCQSQYLTSLPSFQFIRYKEDIRNMSLHISIALVIGTVSSKCSACRLSPDIPLLRRICDLILAVLDEQTWLILCENDKYCKVQNTEHEVERFLNCKAKKGERNQQLGHWYKLGKHS